MSELILIGIDFSALPDAETFYCLWADEGATRGGRETGRGALCLAGLKAYGGVGGERVVHTRQ